MVNGHTIQENVWWLAKDKIVIISIALIRQWDCSSPGDQCHGGFSNLVSCCMRQMILQKRWQLHLISVSPFQQPRKQMHATHVWKAICAVTLWILWKYRCKRWYNYSIIPLLSDILSELWESLLAVVCGQYDNMLGSSEVVLKKRKKILQLWRMLPSVHGLLSRTVLEISSPLVLAPIISFVYNTLWLYICSIPTLFLILMKEIFWGKRRSNEIAFKPWVVEIAF